MGRNLSSIAAEAETSVARLSPGIVKSRMKYSRVPENEESANAEGTAG